MINTRSSFYREVFFVSPLTGFTSKKYTLRIYLWRGDVLDVPNSPEYSITRNNWSDSIGSEDVEISNIIDSYLESLYTDVTSESNATSQNSACQCWSKTTVEYYTNSSSDTGVEQDPIIEFSTRGYGYGNEGKNFQSPNNGVYLSNNIYKASCDSLFIIPASRLNSVLTINISSYPNNYYSNSFQYSQSNSSYFANILLNIDTAKAKKDDRIIVDVNGTETIILIDHDKKYNNTDILFINKYGCQQSLSMRKEMVNKISSKSEVYERSYGQPSDGIHQFKSFLSNGRKSILLNSGFIPESQNSAFEELLLSDSIWIKHECEVIPVNLKTRAIEFKTRVKDSVINYAIEFDYSYNEINNI